MTFVIQLVANIEKAIYKCEICDTNTNPMLTEIFENESQRRTYKEQILSPKSFANDIFSMKLGILKKIQIRYSKGSCGSIYKKLFLNL